MRRYSGRDVSRVDIQEDWLKPKWYVLFVRSNQEKQVAQHLSSRLIDHFLPLHESVHQWKDRKVKLASPLFPGYVFVRLALVDRLKALLVPNVVNLVGTANTPSVVADEEIDWIRRGVTYGKAAPHEFLNAGDAVVIQSGPMAGMEGIFVRSLNGARVLIRLHSISRAFAVEVDREWLEVAPTGVLMGTSPKETHSLHQRMDASDSN